MGRLFGKPDSGVHYETVSRDPGTNRSTHTFAQLGNHLADNVAILRFGIHGFRASSRVHDHQCGARFRHHTGHRRIVSQATDVVHQYRPCVDGRSCDFRFVGIHRDRHREPLGKSVDDRHQTREFLVNGDRLGAGSRRFTSDIDQVGALALQTQSGLDRQIGIELRKRLGERVRRDVEDAHQQAALPKSQDATGRKWDGVRTTRREAHNLEFGIRNSE